MSPEHSTDAASSDDAGLERYVRQMSYAPVGREGQRRLADSEIRPVFEDYLQQITQTAEFVDRL